MKKILISVALGAVAGMVVSEMPTVKQLIADGKRKVRAWMR